MFNTTKSDNPLVDLDIIAVKLISKNTTISYQTSETSVVQPWLSKLAGT